MPPKVEYEHVGMSEDDFDPERTLKASNSASHHDSSCCSRRSCWTWFAILISNLLAFRIGCVYTMLSRTYDYDLHCDSLDYGFLNTQRGQSLVQELVGIASTEGRPSAIRHMKQLMLDDRDINVSCHEVLHTLGELMWQQDAVEGLSLREGFLEITKDFIGTEDEELLRLCSAGYFHGIIEEGMNIFGIVSREDVGADTMGAPTFLEDEATWITENICDVLEGKDEQGSLSNQWECMHGVGHGIMGHRRNVYREKQLLESLTVCTGTNGVAVEGCTNGVWMDYWDVIGMTPGVDLDDPNENPLSVCDGLDKSFDAYSCRLFAPRAYLKRHPRNYAGVMNSFCARAGYHATCIMGVGFQVAKQNKESFLPLEQTCLLAPTVDGRFQCFQGGINHALNFRHNEGKAKLPPSSCDDLSYFQAVCRSHETEQDSSMGDGTHGPYGGRL